ncbi:hypothetical protein [Serinicoccus sediminis]|uniref:hypothetical protein n=1 Tax=Serinicoccus sediminis TaxID=2306021 RepID=UPI0010220FF4|nr:hypothetical protein [Serinicoccus sediminis]
MTNTDLDPQVLADKLAGLRDRYHQLTAARDTIDGELEEIKAAIRDLVPEGKHPAGDGEVTVTPNRRFDEKKALKLIPAEVLPVLTYPETRVHKDALRDLLPDVYDAAQVTYTPRVSVK